MPDTRCQAISTRPRLIPGQQDRAGAFGKVNGTLEFAQAETGSTSLINALLSPNSGAGINNYEGVYPATGGSAAPGFPASRQWTRVADLSRHPSVMKRVMSCPNCVADCLCIAIYKQYVMTNPCHADGIKRL